MSCRRKIPTRVGDSAKRMEGACSERLRWEADNVRSAVALPCIPNIKDHLGLFLGPFENFRSKIGPIIFEFAMCQKDELQHGQYRCRFEPHIFIRELCST